MSTAPTNSIDLPARDHIFISYATEDGALAEWLSLKLTAEGYKVWCDRTHLLGGESYPKDIDFAIKNLTFRVLGLLSKNSINKDNPRKERTLAINIGKERKEDFLIPINTDGLLPTELDWMTSDLTFIPFHINRAEGLARLVKKLNAIGAPKNKEQGRGWVSDWFAGRDNPATKTEQLWTNVIPILEVPKHLFQYEVAGDQPLGALRDMWAFYPKTDNVVWAFGAPPQGLAIVKQTNVLEWQNPEYEKTSVRNIVSYLFKRSMLLHCLRKGMRFIPDNERVYFPKDVFVKDRINFRSYTGKGTYVQVVGERSFRIASYGSEKSRYHLSPVFRPDLKSFDQPVFQLNVRIYLTDLLDRPLETQKALRRRKKICKYWWNHQWLSRFMAVMSWVTSEHETCDILNVQGARLVISSMPVRHVTPLGIDEDILEAVAEEDESEVFDDGHEVEIALIEEDEQSADE